jgi:bleomycin hydrolase
MKQLFFFLLSVSIITCFGQDIRNGTYKEHKTGFYENEIRAANAPTDAPHGRKHFVAELESVDFPTDKDQYTAYWHLPPLSQGATGTCWCFSAISFLETEVYRTTGREVKLSEMYIVYWEYVERARAFVEARGDVYFAEGSETVSVLRIMKKYGIVPAADYTGLPYGRKYHDHATMFGEMQKYLEGVKASGAWNTVMVVSTIRDILDKYMDAPPANILFEGMQHTPATFMHKVLGIKPDDYFSFMSTMSQTYNQKGELVEPDNWWHCDDYYNVSISDFMTVIDDALDSSYTVCMCGDVSEPGYDRWTEVGIVPDFDIPSAYINESAREMRLKNGTTTDDHCIHIVGFMDEGFDRWYLIKDSGAGGFDGPHKGYRFLHEDYVRLKMMNIMVYKEAGRRVLDRIIK